MITVLEFRPSRLDVLTLNQRSHWATKARITANLREWGRLAASGNAAHHRAHCLAELTFPDRRRRDAHNWMPTLKALIDGAVSAGLLPDDDTAHLIGPDVRITDDRCPVGRVHVRLTLTEQET